MTKTVTMTLQLDAAIKEKVDKLAEARNSSPDAFLQEAIGHYVSRSERREIAWQAADEAWEHYSTTGLHVTAEEVDAWLAKLEAGEDAEPPECHT